jgi:hypothetical protein
MADSRHGACRHPPEGAADALVLACALAVYGANRPKPAMDLKIEFAY